MFRPFCLLLGGAVLAALGQPAALRDAARAQGPELPPIKKKEEKSGKEKQTEGKGKTPVVKLPFDIDRPSADLESDLPNPAWVLPFARQQPIHFVTRNSNLADWNGLKAFWNVVDEKAVDPATGQEVARRAVKIKVPLGLNTPPPVPPENPMTVDKWVLGKTIFFDEILSSDRTVSCATCHDPKKGYTDNEIFSLGIRGKRGGMNAPTVINAAYNQFQFWDGRAASLEDQSQGPPQNAAEMFDGTGHAWNRAVRRIREDEKLVKGFKEVFGTHPTRDGIAKSIATYERAVLSGNSVHDRAELAMRARVEEAGTARFEFKASDYARALKEAVAARDTNALKALGLTEKDGEKVADVARRVNSGRALYFGKARCNLCHVGENFTDNGFHNLGVGVKDGKLPITGLGRYGAQPAGHKNPELAGAFKTPTLRALLSTPPYMHDGSEKTLEAVVDFYDRGGNANEFLDSKMRDVDTERAFELARQQGKKWEGPTVETFGPGNRPVVPLKLNLAPQEKADLVLFLKALQGDPIDPIVADRGARVPR